VMRVEGIVVPLITPLTRAGVNEEALVALIESLLRAGVHGLFVGGTTSEGPLLTIEERRTALRAARRAAGGRVPVLAAVGAVSTDETLRLCGWAADDGADGLVALTPYFFAFSQGELRAHLEAVLRHSPVPVALYDIPQRTGNRLAPETVAALMPDERLVSIKDSSGNMGHFLRLLRVARPDVTVLMGDDALILPAMAAGAHGAVSGLANVCPEIFVRLYRAIGDGDWPLARRLQAQVIEGQDAILAESSIPASLKAVLVAQGIAAGEPKPPMAPLLPEARERVVQALRRAGLLP
jgi:4-hydroxy-tetrahydrodipicolinate synthase